MAIELEINLKQIPGACQASLQFGDGRTRDCIVIPTDTDFIYVNDKKASIRCNVFQRMSEWSTHSLKLKYTGETYKNHSEEERKKTPYIGFISGGGSLASGSSPRPSAPTASSPVSPTQNGIPF